MRILIADDEPVWRLLIAELLRGMGHQAVTAEDGLQAWKAFEKETFPVVVTDWVMPEIDGMDLCRRIRAARREQYTYCILITVLGGKESYMEAMRAGADDFITKPVDPDALEARLLVADRVLGLQQHVQRLEELLQLCAWCKRVHTSDTWMPLEKYVAQQSGQKLTHGLCPDCAQRLATTPEKSA
jgi:DNA-binding response OmpR family regulator